MQQILRFFLKWCWAGAEGRTVFEIAMEDLKEDPVHMMMVIYPNASKHKKYL